MPALSLPLGNPRTLALLAFLLALAAIVGAWGSELFAGLVPCELCLEQRQPYYYGLPLLAVGLVFWPRLTPTIRQIGLGLVALIFLWGAGLGIYHAGVEWTFWPGPTACTGTGEGLSFEDLSNVNGARVIPCDQVQFRFLGVSLAGYNALVMLGAALLLARAALGLRR